MNEHNIFNSPRALVLFVVFDFKCSYPFMYAMLYVFHEIITLSPLHSVCEWVLLIYSFADFFTQVFDNKLY